MAGELNIFRTVTADVTSGGGVVYTAPTDYTGIILMAQLANVTSTTGTFTFSHEDVAGTTITELAKDFAVPGNDSVSATTGKLVLEEGQKVRVSASANNKFKLVLSILESANA
jgi:hypothetical protein